MAFEITIPRLGWSMEEGTFVRWLKNDGQTIQPGEPLFELEGEKAAQDIEAVDGGILRIPSTAPKPGATVAVGTVIGYLVSADESTPGNVIEARTESAPVADSLPPPAAPSVRRLARERGLNLGQLSGSGPAGRITAADLETTGRAMTIPQSGPALKASSPRARRIARELGVDWRRAAGTGRDGRVREQDIRRLAADGHRPTVKSTTSAAAKIAISRHRRTIADRMSQSRQATAPVTLTTTIDATNLVSLRQQFKSAGGDHIPSYSDIVVKLVAIALRQHPLLMSQWVNESLIIPEIINIGIAVDTDAGLVVPVIHDVTSRALLDVSSESARLISLARAGELKAADMQSGVFTVTNLGGFGIDAFTPIINYPEAAILGLGRIRREPVVVDHQIIPRDRMTLSLTFDHRIVDGAPAARFLQSLSAGLETPSAWLLRN